MDYFRDLLEKKHMPQLVLTILFALYLILGYKLPNKVSEMVDKIGRAHV